uniref:Protein BIG1 n=1 Tax=Panagrolaimus sp. PS1159 TaxID=55785 RepID=A0AC35FTS2_9BILA
MFYLYRSILLALSLSTLINAAYFTIENKEILDVETIQGDNYYQCPLNNDPYDQKLLRIDDTINKNFIVLLHPSLKTNLTLRPTAETFLQSMRCYFGNISFEYITFLETSQNSSYDVHNSICDAFDRLSDRDSRSLKPLVAVFPPTKSKLIAKSSQSNQAYPPCTQFQTIAMTIQATIEADGFVSLYLRSNVADYVIKSVPDCPTLFDSIAAIMNPLLHTEYHFPYRPLQLMHQTNEIEPPKWHTAALIGIGIGFILIFFTPGIIVWRRVKAHQKERDQDRKLREAMLKSKCEDVA